MAKVYYEEDASIDALKDKVVAVVGYGSQGRHQSLNMRDSGIKVIIAELEGTDAWNLAKEDGFEVVSADEATKRGDLIIIVVPDELHEPVYWNFIHDNLKEGKTIGVSHGYSIMYGLIRPPEGVDIVMIAPKAPGPTVRRTYTEGFGVPSCIAVEKDYSGNALKIALAWGNAIGSARVGIIETTIKEEVETDHFGEVAVLCGGCAELIKAGFETLVEAGYQPEIAYFECLNELKLIVDLIYDGGIEYMWDAVSNTAEYGGRVPGKDIVTPDVKENMKALLKDIQNGEHARNWILEQKAGMPVLNRLRAVESKHQIEEVGRNLRSMMRKKE
ncbi:MAG: ketol-acid reductoisomerase [Halobacteriota archaeon]|nr:ketol-acid reductoisomerase [Halobacteriota archaeon]